MDRAAFEDKLRREGYDEIVVGERPANDSMAEHAHHFDVALLVLKGAITLTRNGTAQTYVAGDRCEMAAGTPHAEDIGPEGVQYLLGRRH